MNFESDSPKSIDPVDEPAGPDADELLTSRSLANYLGVQPDYAPDELAPPVDRELLRRFARRELAPAARDEVSQLIAGYRSWESAYRELAQDSPTPAGPTPERSPDHRSQ